MGGGFVLGRGGVGVEAVDLAAGQGGCVEEAVWTEADDLDGEVFGFEELEGFAVFADADNGGGRGGAEEGGAVGVDGNRPDECGGCGDDFSGAGALENASVAGDGDALRSSFFEFFEARLGPEVRALGEGEGRGEDHKEDGNERRGKGGGAQDAAAAIVWGEGNKHAAVESTKVDGLRGRVPVDARL